MQVCIRVKRDLELELNVKYFCIGCTMQYVVYARTGTTLAGLAASCKLNLSTVSLFLSQEIKSSYFSYSSSSPPSFQEISGNTRLACNFEFTWKVCVVVVVVVAGSNGKLVLVLLLLLLQTNFANHKLNKIISYVAFFRKKFFWKTNRTSSKI